jgi:hypothetical protein
MSGSKERRITMEKRKSAEFLVKADIGKVVCVDERKVDWPEEESNTNNLVAVKIPGGIYGIVDALKSVLHISENEAWDIIVKTNLPIVIHNGPEHSHDPSTNGGVGPNGCGYANLVENSPEKVLAPEPVSAKSRTETVKKLGGQIYSVTGEHKIDQVTIVWKERMTIDQQAALNAGVGILDCDAWAAGIYANKINECNPEISLNKEEFVQQIVKEFKAVAAVLAPELTIEEIR